MNLFAPKESENESEVAQLCPTLCDPMDCSPPGSSVHGILRQEYWSGLPFPSPGFPDPGTEPSSPALQADALTSEPPGKRTEGGDPLFNFLKVKSESQSRSGIVYSSRPRGLYSPGNSPGQNTGVGSHSLFQGIFPTQGLNLGLPHYRQILYQLSHQGSPRILQWVAYPFSSGSSQPRSQTRVSCIGRQILYQLSYQGSLH